MQGIDVAADPGLLAGRLKAAGVGFAAGYYSYNDAKNLTPEGARSLTAAGIAIVSIFEAAGDKYANFTEAQGHADALQAMKLAQACQQPGGSGLYFAVDFDATATQLLGGINDYFKAIKAVIPAQYRIGAYGSGLVCESLSQWGLVELRWLGGATGWRGSHGYDRAHIRQGQPGDPYNLGLTVDPDVAIDGDFGQWQVAGVPAAPTSNYWAEYIKITQRYLADDGFYHGAIDGTPGPLTYSALRAAWRASAPR